MKQATRSKHLQVLAMSTSSWLTMHSILWLMHAYIRSGFTFIHFVAFRYACYMTTLIGNPEQLTVIIIGKSMAVNWRIIHADYGLPCTLSLTVECCTMQRAQLGLQVVIVVVFQLSDQCVVKFINFSCIVMMMIWCDWVTRFVNGGVDEVGISEYIDTRLSNKKWVWMRMELISLASEISIKLDAVQAMHYFVCLAADKETPSVLES